MEPDSQSIDDELHRLKPQSAQESKEIPQKLTLFERYRRAPKMAKSFDKKARKVAPEMPNQVVTPLSPSFEIVALSLETLMRDGNQRAAIELIKKHPSQLTDEVFINAYMAGNSKVVTYVINEIKLLHRCNTRTIEDTFPSLNVAYDLDHSLIAKCLDQLTEEQFIDVLQQGLVATNIFSILLHRGNLETIRTLVKKGLARPSYIEFREILTSRHTDIAVLCFKKIKQRTDFVNGLDVIRDIINLFNDKTTIIDALYLLNCLDRNDSFIMSLKYTARRLNDILEQSYMTKSVILDHWNPILVAVIASDFCEQIKSYSTTDNKLLSRLSKDYKLLAERIQNEIDDIEQIKAIYIDTSYPGGTLLELTTHKANKYRKLLKSPLVTQLVKSFWYGKNKLVYGIDRCSYVVSCLNSEMEPLELWTIFMAQPLPQVHSFFQFKSWINSCNIRYTFEVMWIVIFVVQLGVSSKVYIDDTDLFQKYHSLKADLNELSGFTQTVFRAEVFFSMFLLLLIANYLQRVVYMHYTGDKPRLDARGVINFMLMAVFILLTIETEIDTILHVYDYYMGLMCLIGVMRLLVALSVTSTFGKIITMVVIIFQDILPYLGLLGIVCYGYTMAGYVMFSENAEYSSIAKSFKTLFSAATGNYSFDELIIREEVNVIFLISWVIVANVLMLNLLIAVLSSRYEKLAPKIQADYVSILYNFYKAFKPHTKYGGMSICPTPLNAISLPFLPLYFTTINKTRLNLLISHISYIPMLIIVLLIFTIQNLILAPVAYFYCIYVLFMSRRNSCYNEVVKLIIFWVLLAPFYMIFLICASTKFLCQYLYSADTDEDETKLTEKTIRNTLILLEDKIQESAEDTVIAMNDIKRVLFKPKKSTIAEFMNSRTADRNRFSKFVKTVVKNHHHDEEDEVYDQLKLVHKFADYERHEVNLQDTVTFLKMWDSKRIECVDFYLSHKGYEKFIKARNSFFIGVG